MLILKAEPAYRPITIILESPDDLDKFLTIFQTVANNSINHSPRTVAAAKEFLNMLQAYLED